MKKHAEQESQKEATDAQKETETKKGAAPDAPEAATAATSETEKADAEGKPAAEA